MPSPKGALYDSRRLEMNASDEHKEIGETDCFGSMRSFFDRRCINDPKHRRKVTVFKRA